MTSIVAIAVVIALILFVVYYVKRSATAEIEKATLDNSKVAHDEKIKLLENQALRAEAEKRKQETENANRIEDDSVKSDVRFYPDRLLPNKDKDRLN